MKNQYVGDIGDFGKYSMLRAFIDAGIKVGVNWYLTEDDGSNDGKFTDYFIKCQDPMYKKKGVRTKSWTKIRLITGGGHAYVFLRRKA